MRVNSIHRTLMNSLFKKLLFKKPSDKGTFLFIFECQVKETKVRTLQEKS